MKPAKFIIPLIGISQLNNANKQELLLAKKVDVSYQILKVENEPSYFSIVNSLNTTENLIQNEARKLAEVRSSTPEECWEMLQVSLASCALLGPFAEFCVAAAWVAFAACMANAGN